DVDRDEVAADFRNMAAAERTQAAMLAEQVVALPGAELVVRQCVVPRQQTKRVGLDERSPVARLPADRAVAFAGAGGEIDIRLETNGAAVAASCVGLQHRWLSGGLEVGFLGRVSWVGFLGSVFLGRILGRSRRVATP